jgi:hypothetical protein
MVGDIARVDAWKEGSLVMDEWASVVRGKEVFFFAGAPLLFPAAHEDKPEFRSSLIGSVGTIWVAQRLIRDFGEEIGSSGQGSRLPLIS